MIVTGVRIMSRKRPTRVGTDFIKKKIKKPQLTNLDFYID